MIAYVVISKYQHHLPLYRIEAMSAQWGAALNRKTMVDWVRVAADWAEPIYKLMHAELLRGHYVQCDETPVKFIDPDEKSRGTTQGYLWVVSAPGGDVVFDWRLSRRHGELTTLLNDNYTGLLQSDGYQAYDAYARSHPAVVWLGCWPTPGAGSSRPSRNIPGRTRRPNGTTPPHPPSHRPNSSFRIGHRSSVIGHPPIPRQSSGLFTPSPGLFSTWV